MELTARQAKIKLCFRGWRRFKFLAFIENDTQKLVAARVLSPTCQPASFFKQILRIVVGIIIIKEMKLNQAVTLKSFFLVKFRA